MKMHVTPERLRELVAAEPDDVSIMAGSDCSRIVLPEHSTAPKAGKPSKNDNDSTS